SLRACALRLPSLTSKRDFSSLKVKCSFMARALMIPRRARSYIRRSNPASSVACEARGAARGLEGGLPELGAASLRFMAPDLIAMSQAPDQNAKDDVQDAKAQSQHRDMGRCRQYECQYSENDEHRTHDADESRDRRADHRACG